MSAASAASALNIEPQQRKSVSASAFSPAFFHEVVGPDFMILPFVILRSQLCSLPKVSLLKLTKICLIFYVDCIYI